MTTPAHDLADAFLGVDCGGSKSRWLWLPARAGDDGGRGAGVQPAVQGEGRAAADLAAVLRAAVAQRRPRACVAALAGAGDRGVAQRLAAALPAAGIAVPTAVVGDVLAATAGALGGGPGVLVWAGTGSFAVARAADGSLHRTGGRGHLLGDQGSAYDLVRRAAAAVVLAADDLGAPTALTAALVAAFSAPSPQRLGAVLQQLATGEVAARLPAVLAAAAAGDAVADQVLDEGIEALAMVANAAVRTAGLAWPGLPVVVGGGVLHGSDGLRERLAERLRAFGAGTVTVADADAGARGAALLAAAWYRRERPLCDWVEHGAL